MANQYTSKFPDRFWNKVEKGDTCWIWTARKNKYGYGYKTKSVNEVINRVLQRI